MQEQYRLKFVLVNLFTLLRMALFPIILILVLNGGLTNILIAFLLFIFGALTDAFDGILARKYNAESKFGFTIDPIADKFLVLGTLFSMTLIDYLSIPLWLFLIILVRDIIVSILKPISDKLGFPIPTTLFAKTKTTIQFIGIIVIFIYLVILNYYFYPISKENIVSKVGEIILLPYYTSLIITVITVISGIEYIALFISGYSSIKKK